RGLPAPTKAARKLFPITNRNRRLSSEARRTSPIQRAGRAAPRLHQATTATSAGRATAALSSGAKPEPARESAKHEANAATTRTGAGVGGRGQPDHGVIK